MKVMHVETGRHFYGGGQQVVWLAEGLMQQGIESVLVCNRGAAIAKRASERGLRCVELSCAGDLDLRFGWQLYRLIRKEQPDLVHCHSRRGADWLGGRAAQRAGVPAVVSRRVDNRESPWLARSRYRPYRRIVAISEAIAGVLRADGVDPARIEVIRSAVDVTRFAKAPDRTRFVEKFGKRDDERLLFCVAQLIPRKGHRFLLEALALLKPRYANLRLVLFGNGPQEADLRAQVKRLGLEDTVLFAGFQHDLDDYLGCAELLVHPALEEGLGVATLKAAAAGVPVIAFAAGGVREAVVHDQTGLLVTSGDSDALAAAVAELLDDPARCRQFAENGKKRMQADFTVTDMVNAHRRLYRSTIDERD